MWIDCSIVKTARGENVEHALCGYLFITVLALIFSCIYHKPRLKKFWVKWKKEETFHSLFSRRNSVAYMEPKNESGPIPTGWTLLTEVLPDGSIVAVLKILLYILWFFFDGWGRGGGWNRWILVREIKILLTLMLIMWWIVF